MIEIEIRIVSQSSRLILEAEKHAGRPGGQMVSCRRAMGCICHWATPVFIFVVSTHQEGKLAWFPSFWCSWADRNGLDGKGSR